VKSIVCTTLGEPSLLEVKEVSMPSLSDDDVLVKVQTAGVNFPDALLVQGKYQIVIDPPFTPGNEVCGLIEDTGSNVDIPIGTKVIGLPPVGGFAEYVAVNKNLVIPASESKSSLTGITKFLFTATYSANPPTGGKPITFVPIGISTFEPVSSIKPQTSFPGVKGGSITI
jgi:NADPH:quinone reductase-like Zn-dependent oxidoreductase